MCVTRPAGRSVCLGLWINAFEDGYVVMRATESEMGWTLGRIMNRHEWLVREVIGPQVLSLGDVPGLRDKKEFIVGDM